MARVVAYAQQCLYICPVDTLIFARFAINVDAHSDLLIRTPQHSANFSSIRLRLPINRFLSCACRERRSTSELQQDVLVLDQ